MSSLQRRPGPPQPSHPGVARCGLADQVRRREDGNLLLLLIFPLELCLLSVDDDCDDPGEDGGQGGAEARVAGDQGAQQLLHST